MRAASLVMSLGVVAGCVAEPGPATEPETAILTEASLAGLPVFEDPEQGRHILGSFADTLATSVRHFRVSSLATLGGVTYTVSVLPAGQGGVNGSNLTATGGGITLRNADPGFAGMIFSGVSGGWLRITGVSSAPTTSAAPSARYSLEYSAGGGGWIPYCADGGGAIALQGEYDLTRTHLLTSSITFSCADGVATKCDTWGYVAGTGGPTSLDWMHHQACTGMANAAYCGDGAPFTREKTPIRIRDFRDNYAYGAPTDLAHPDPLPGDPDTFYVEAGWDRQGHPVCLSKLRWRSLPPNPCPGVLADPRFTPSSEGGVFCDDIPVMKLALKGAILVNGSKMMDAPLQRWRNPQTGDEVSTIRGFVIDTDTDGQADPGSTLPYPDYTQYLGTDGMLLRNLPGTLDPTQMLPLYMQAQGSDRYLSSTVPPAALQQSLFEGYAFLSPTTVGGLQPLTLCTTANGRDTTITPCPGGVNLKYALPAP